MISFKSKYLKDVSLCFFLLPEVNNHKKRKQVLIQKKVLAAMYQWKSTKKWTSEATVVFYSESTDFFSSY